MSLSNDRAAMFDSAAALARRAVAPIAALEVLQRWLRRGLPQCCALCAARSGDALICPACASSLPRNLSPCATCALPVNDGATCGACLSRPPPYSHCVAAWSYAFPVDRLVQALKYGGQLALAEPFAHALASSVLLRGSPMPDTVVALPLSRARQRERGFNQAQEIARHVAARVGVRLFHGLARERDGPPQVSLDWDARSRNMRGAFRGHGSLAGCRVAIVDDVMTTGATLSAAATAALDAGARDVVAWVVARTPKRSERIAA